MVATSKLTRIDLISIFGFVTRSEALNTIRNNGWKSQRGESKEDYVERLQELVQKKNIPIRLWTPNNVKALEKKIKQFEQKFYGVDMQQTKDDKTQLDEKFDQLVHIDNNIKALTQKLIEKKEQNRVRAEMRGKATNIFDTSDLIANQAARSEYLQGWYDNSDYHARKEVDIKVVPQLYKLDGHEIKLTAKGTLEGTVQIRLLIGAQFSYQMLGVMLLVQFLY